MFDPETPRVFALPPGADFPLELVRGLQDRMSGQPPEAMASVRLYVNTSRMRRRVVDLFCQSGAGFLPNIRLIAELGSEMAFSGIPPAVPPLRRRLQLAQLIRSFVLSQPDFAPLSAVHDLADSLAALMDEMQGEGVVPADIAAIDVAEHSGYWLRTQRFMGIVADYLAQTPGLDSEARQRAVVEHLAGLWSKPPPQGPVIIAGSTGSRGTTALFMRAVAALPNGALVLPGYDFDMPDPAWSALKDVMAAEDHPQYRFFRLLNDLGIDRAGVRLWRDTPAPCPPRNALISLSLRPAPVTDQWLKDGEKLTQIASATEGMTLIEATSAREEAVAVALILRKAAEDGRTAALITPDRGLTRQVTAALDRWGILPDDSAGRPLALSAPGRLLRHVAALIGQRLSAEALLALLKHPLVATGGDRGLHLRLTRELELHLRRHGPAFPTGTDLVRWAATLDDEAAPAWAAGLAKVLHGLDAIGSQALAEHVARHRAVAEALALGTGPGGTGALWDEEAGLAALGVLKELAAEAGHGGFMSPNEYADLFTTLLNKGQVRDPSQPHPSIMIWGTLEARVQGADLVILGGLNDGSWPKLPDPDPWLNRQMRKDSGLLLPDRQIGLSAHDYQQAVAAKEVVLTRAHRDADAETVPSRWVNRLGNLLNGLAKQGGLEALAAMRARGKAWLALAQALETTTAKVDPAPRPSPRPPVAARPKELYVTAISALIRDPYAIYARYILGLRPLNPLRQAADARQRGEVLHLVLQRFVETRPDVETDARARLMQTARDVLQDAVQFPAARALWLARLDRAADMFLAFDRDQGGVTLVLEYVGKTALTPLDFTLLARPDRIDVLPDGRLNIIDYKTGTLPTPAQQRHFDKQLLLQAAMAERGGFGGPAEVAQVTYVGLGAEAKARSSAITTDLTGEIWQGLIDLIRSYQCRSKGYTSRRAVVLERHKQDYDDLARFGEWELSQDPLPGDVG